MLKNNLIFVISIYQYFMPILTVVCLIIVPLIQVHQHFDTFLIDILVRSFLCLYFAFAYWSIALAIKKRMYNKPPFGINFELHKNIVSFALLSVGAIGLGSFLFLLTHWSLTAYLPQLPSKLTFVLSLSNGLIYSGLILLQYLFLPED